MSNPLPLDHLAVVRVGPLRPITLPDRLRLLRDRVGHRHQAGPLHRHVTRSVRERYPQVAVRMVPHLIVNRRTHPAAADQTDPILPRHHRPPLLRSTLPHSRESRNPSHRSPSLRHRPQSTLYPFLGRGSAATDCACTLQPLPFREGGGVGPPLHTRTYPCQGDHRRARMTSPSYSQGQRPAAHTARSGTAPRVYPALTDRPPCARLGYD